MLVGTSQIKTFNVYVTFGIKESVTLLVHLWKEKKKRTEYMLWYGYSKKNFVATIVAARMPNTYSRTFKAT